MKMRAGLVCCVLGVACSTVPPPEEARPDAGTAAVPSSSSVGGGSSTMQSSSMLPSSSGACGDVTAAGQCAGNAVVRCENGVVARHGCGGARACAVDTSGAATCAPADRPGCGTVDVRGYCDGDVSVTCGVTSEIERVDCAPLNQVCTFQGDAVGWRCAPPPGGEARRVRGRFLFEKRPATANGLGPVQQRPVREALVYVLREGDSATLGTAYTQRDGTFDLRFGAEAGVHAAVVVLTRADSAGYSVRVADCPREDCGSDGVVHAASSPSFSVGTNTDLGTLLITQAGGAGAFNIHDTLITGLDFTWEVLQRRPPPLNAQWAALQEPLCVTCFRRLSNTLFVTGKADNPDEYDDSVMLHEFGHFLHFAFSRSDSPGGYHDGTPTDPTLAFTEGYGTYVGCTIGRSPLYVDASPSGASVTDISADPTVALPDDPLGMEQPVSEYAVAECLWSISHGTSGFSALGDLGSFDVIHNYLPSAAFTDRGVAGVDFVDFLDGWFCRGQGQRPMIETIVNNQHGFPYDHAQLPPCP